MIEAPAQEAVRSPHTLLLNLPRPLAGCRQAAVNTLSGALHLVSPGEARALTAPEAVRAPRREWLEEGFFFPSPAAAAAYQQERRREFDEAYAQTPVQLLLVPTYACELACPYCYQRSFDASGLMSERQVELALDAPVGAGRERFVTLFGGEPLGAGPALRRVVRKILTASKERGLAVAVVTNGFRLEEWLADLQLARIKEIQVTLDGGPDQHDQRRRTRSGEPTFWRIVRGVDAALAAGYTVNLRAVVDRSNLAGLADLARIAGERGWLDQPAGRFKTQLGRNYELYDAYACPQELFGLEEMYAAYVDLAGRHPELRRFHQPSFYGLTEWLEQGEMLAPRFDACPAGKHEWGFDPSGHVYGCTATLGHPAHRLGRYDPAWEPGPQLARWQARRVETVAACADCPVAPACGAGCGALAHARQGSLSAPDCKPIAAVWEQGLRWHADRLEQKIKEAMKP
ncbi:MAG: radical SAM protein [candidate division FCPU426 bacterium]